MISEECKKVICEIYNNVLEDCSNTYFSSKSIKIKNRDDRFKVCIIEGLIHNLSDISNKDCYLTLVRILANCDFELLNSLCV